MLLASVYLHGQSAATPDSKDASTTIFIQGRVLAAIDSPFHGAGVGPKYESFIFGLEKTKGQMLPIKIRYAYFGRHGLSASFFDYTKRYELAAVRDASCDETVSSLSLIRNVDSSGRELPPTDALRPMNGAPKGLLKPEMSLSCYIVEEERFKAVPSDK
jgi:hypothetical protein